MNDLREILLIEDNPDDHEATIRSFKKAKLLNPVHWCPSGQDALDYLCKKGKIEGTCVPTLPALILLDLNMPGVDGRQVLKAIKADSQMRRVPVIVLTTSSDVKDINRCYDLGASTYVQKPVGFESLIEAVARLKDYWFGVAILPQYSSSTE